MAKRGVGVARSPFSNLKINGARDDGVPFGRVRHPNGMGYRRDGIRSLAPTPRAISPNMKLNGKFI